MDIDDKTSSSFTFNTDEYTPGEYILSLTLGNSDGYTAYTQKIITVESCGGKSNISFKYYHKYLYLIKLDDCEETCLYCPVSNECEVCVPEFNREKKPGQSRCECNPAS